MLVAYDKLNCDDYFRELLLPLFPFPLPLKVKYHSSAEWKYFKNLEKWHCNTKNISFSDQVETGNPERR